MKESQKKSASFWGVLATGILLLEEMGELIQAVVKYFRSTIPGLIPTSKSTEDIMNNLAEEIADVRICLDELEYLLCLEQDTRSWGRFKRRREKERLRRYEAERKEEKT